MSWSTPRDLKVQLARLWERGELLRDVLTGTPRFPLRLILKGPNSADITDRFEAVRQWAAELAAAPPVRLEWQALRHRVQGTQRLPGSAWVDSVEDALGWLGRRTDWERFVTQVAMTRQARPELLSWLEKRPLQALALADDWPRLLAVVAWMIAHPRPRIYLRQVDLPGVHTKFIETHRGVLSELLDLVLPPEAVDAGQRGTNQFAARFGFLDKPLRIRFRLLDPQIPSVPGVERPDIALDADSFARSRLDVQRVFITENETNFLAFPDLPKAIVVFGAGYGWEALGRSRWLNGCALYYWGDIDTHGFAILDQLRSCFPHVESFLMDRATLDEHRPVWGREEGPATLELSRLNSAERALYDDLRYNRIRPGLRLEQEHVRFGWLARYLASLR